MFLLELGKTWEKNRLFLRGGGDSWEFGNKILDC